MRNGVQKVAGAVQRVDDPAVRSVRPFQRAAFFLQKTVAGADFQQIFAQSLFGIQIGRRSKIRGAFFGNLQFFQFSEIAGQSASGLLHRLNHDVQIGGQSRNKAVLPGFAVLFDGIRLSDGKGRSLNMSGFFGFFLKKRNGPFFDFGFSLLNFPFRRPVFRHGFAHRRFPK